MKHLCTRWQLQRLNRVSANSIAKHFRWDAIGLPAAMLFVARCSRFSFWAVWTCAPAATGDAMATTRWYAGPGGATGRAQGLKITMIAISLAEEVRSADDIGVKVELAPILFTFDPGHNF